MRRTRAALRFVLTFCNVRSTCKPAISVRRPGRAVRVLGFPSVLRFPWPDRHRIGGARPNAGRHSPGRLRAAGQPSPGTPGTIRARPDSQVDRRLGDGLTAICRGTRERGWSTSSGAADLYQGIRASRSAASDELRTPSVAAVKTTPLGSRCSRGPSAGHSDGERRARQRQPLDVVRDEPVVEARLLNSSVDSGASLSARSR